MTANNKMVEKSGRSRYFKPTEITPEIRKELDDPKGWVTGRLLPKKRKQQNVVVPKKGGRGKGKGWTKKRKSYELPAETEKELEESPEAD